MFKNACTLITHHVRTDSLYGVKTFFLVSACSDRAEMTFPRVSKDLLMLAPSYNDSQIGISCFEVYAVCKVSR